MKAFRLQTIANGWSTFTDATDTQYRVESKGCGIFAIYIKKGNVFIFDCAVGIKGKVSAKKIYEAYLEALNQMTDEDYE